MSGDPILEVRRLTKRYLARRWLSSAPTRAALCDVSFDVRSGQTLALVGRSGSGKSTLARCLSGRERPSAGEIRFQGRATAEMARHQHTEFRRAVQMIAQDPGASLNPRWPAWRIIREPLSVLRANDARAGGADLMTRVGLPPGSADWLPARFSGGQKARLALARALVVLPRVLILDESLGALDLSVQAQIVNLLLDLQEAYGLAYVLISHDLGLAGHLADQVIVLDDGRIVERGAPAELLRAPAHPCTRALLAAAPAMGEV